MLLLALALCLLAHARLSAAVPAVVAHPADGVIGENGLVSHAVGERGRRLEDGGGMDSGAAGGMSGAEEAAGAYGTVDDGAEEAADGVVAGARTVRPGRCAFPCPFPCLFPR